MNTITGPQYYHTRALYFQYKYSNYADLDLNNAVRCGLNDREVDAWVQLHRTISQDAFAELVTISEDLGWKHPGLFLSPSLSLIIFSHCFWPWLSR